MFWKLGGEGGHKRVWVGGARLRRRDERKQAVDTGWRKWKKTSEFQDGGRRQAAFVKRKMLIGG